MDTYITGDTIRQIREKKGLTQVELAEQLQVSNKTISKWENAKGLPDISLIEPLALALGVSLPELMSGNTIVNRNVSANMLHTKWYICPVCGNVIHAIGESVHSCCGIALPSLDAEEFDEEHMLTMQQVEDEYYLSVAHSMTKSHYLSFLAYVTSDHLHFVKFYPEGNAECRIKIKGRGVLFLYCNRHGLMNKRLPI